MNRKSIGFKLVDALLILMMILPLVGAMAIQVMTKPASDGVAIAGARIFFTIHMPIQDLPITESQVNTWLIMISLFFLCLFFTHGLTEKCESKRQAIAEWIVEKTDYKLKGGFLNYLKSFTEPVPVLTPFNVISEFATPVSMSFRHYGNVLSGSVISALVAVGLQSVSHLILGWIPGKLGDFPLFQIGLPAVLSLYFDIFSGCMQAFIFAMLTMIYVSGAFPIEEWQKRREKKKQKKAAKQKAA